ncbi:ABC transporter ATP-binding protein [Cochlodiniinecator piscidefendens]|uniref:ABC transporter ATP-binding protein n=1 Tax=Cochlodiniinecator piscidefendens TaxID=2715756 RepID=UPI00140BCAE0|nr:ABC transporter ATP-binding protein [Cochlodiniinecator piscidefendens]
MTDTVLSVTNLSKFFGALKASDNVNIDLHAGEIHALIGPNGAGKSTLIKQIAGGMRPDKGEVILNGQDISALDTAARARLGLARSFQVSSVAAEFTVLQNVVLAVQGHQNLGMWRAALRKTAFSDQALGFIARAGLAGREAIRASDLSHGERRRLELAMALALRPKVFLLDEPMAGVGLEGSADMTALLDDLRHEAPILLVEHDMDAVFSLADRISVLVYGRIIATGAVDDIRNDLEVQRAYLGDDA